MHRQVLDQLKARWSLLDYLKEHDWKPCRRTARGQIGGLCPVHQETQPSFWIHPVKQVFFCHGCGQGGDLIRLMQLLEQVSFRQAVEQLRFREGRTAMIADAAAFYRRQLPRHGAAGDYLQQRGVYDPEVIGALGIGYAPGGCLRAHLSDLGYGVAQMREAGLIDAQGRDVFYRRIVFGWDSQLYGRGIDGHMPHRFLSGSKGGLYNWGHLQYPSTVILVEGMFDLAALYQAGFRHTTCSFGTHLNPAQLEQLTQGLRTVFIAFDGDEAGRRGAQHLAEQLAHRGQPCKRVFWPAGHDAASYFAAGAVSEDFQHLLDEARS